MEFFQARVLEWVAISFSRGDLPNLGIKPGSPTLQADALPSEPPRISYSDIWLNIMLGVPVSVFLDEINI